MYGAARAGDWDAVARLSVDRDLVVRRLFADLVPQDAAGVERSDLSRLAELDARLLRLTRDECDRCGEQVVNNKTALRARRAYRSAGG